MIVNTKVRYGLRTMVEIASHYPQSGVLQKDVAASQDISIKYLDHIIMSLKIAGLITNIGGKKQGYKLSKEPKDISVYDVWRAVNPEICLVDCLSPNVSCKRAEDCPVKTFWGNLNSSVINYLKSTSLQNLLDSSGSSI